MKPFFEKLNKIIERFMWAIAPAGIITGVLLGDSISALRGTGVYFFAFMTFTGSISMKVSDFSRVLKHPKNVGIFLIINHILITILGVFLGKLFFGESIATVEGIALVLGGPVAVTSFMWTSVYKGDSPLSLTLILIDTLITPIVLPLTMRLTFGTTIEMNTSSLMLSLCWMVVLPVLLAVAVNELSHGKVSSKAGIYLKPFGKVALFFALVANSSSVSDDIMAIRMSDIGILFFCLFLTIAGFCTAYFSSGLFGLSRKCRITLTFAGGMRNTSAALVVAVTFFSPAAGVPVILTILFQQLCSAIFSNIFLSEKKKKTLRSAAVVTRSGQVLLTRTASGGCELPKTAVRDDEEARQAIRRLLGETGSAKVKTGKRLNTEISGADNGGTRTIYFQCKPLTETPTGGSASLFWANPVQLAAVELDAADRKAVSLVCQ